MRLVIRDMFLSLFFFIYYIHFTSINTTTTTTTTTNKLMVRVQKKLESNLKPFHGPFLSSQFLKKIITVHSPKTNIL